MDKAIHKTLDNRDSLATSLSEFIDKSFKGLKIDDILTHPEGELSIFAETLAQSSIDKFGTKFIYEGVRFADEIKKMKKPVVVQDSQDPKENNASNV